MNLAIGSLTLLLAGGMAFQTTPAAVKPAPDAGGATTTFHSDVLHLDYTYPQSFASMGNAGDQAMQEERDKATGAAKVAISCISLPLTTMDLSNGLRMIFIMRIDGECLGSTVPVSGLEDATTRALSGSLQRFGEPAMHTASTYQVGGHDASVVSGTVKSEKFSMTIYGAATCMVQGKDTVCFELIASDCAQLPLMMSYPLQIDGKAGEALIPAKFAPACAP